LLGKGRIRIRRGRRPGGSRHTPASVSQVYFFCTLLEFFGGVLAFPAFPAHRVGANVELSARERLFLPRKSIYLRLFEHMQIHSRKKQMFAKYIVSVR
jgi:hypothetical protein